VVQEARSIDEGDEMNEQDIIKEAEEILEGFKRPHVIKNITNRLYSAPEREEAGVLKALRNALTAVLRDQEPSFDGINRSERLLALSIVANAIRNDLAPWATERELTKRTAKALVFDRPELATAIERAF